MSTSPLKTSWGPVLLSHFVPGRIPYLMWVWLLGDHVALGR